MISGWGTGAKDGEGHGEITGPGSGGCSLACVSESPITSWEGGSYHDHPIFLLSS